MKKISIIIVTYNSESHIYDCLNSIFLNNDIGDQLEVIIVDNNSKRVDEMFNCIRFKYKNNICLLKNSDNGGYGQGNNIGIEYSTAPYFMIMNPDVRLSKPIFKNALQAFSNSNIAMLGIKQLLTNGKTGISYSVKAYSDPLFQILGTVISNRLGYYSFKNMYLCGACFFMRKDIFIEIGSFDEKMFLYGEENDLHYRLRKLRPDLKIAFEKDLNYIHLSDDRSLSIDTMFRMLNSNLYFCKKNGLKDSLFLKREIKRAKFFRLIEKIKNRTSNYNFYSDWIKTMEKLNEDNKLA